MSFRTDPGSASCKNSCEPIVERTGTNDDERNEQAPVDDGADGRRTGVDADAARRCRSDDAQLPCRLSRGSHRRLGTCHGDAVDLASSEVSNTRAAYDVLPAPP